MSKLYNRKIHLASLKNRKNILSVHKENLLLNFDRKMNSAKFNTWNNIKEEEELVMKYEYIKEAKVNEDTSFVPRFSLKKYKHKLFAKFPPNKQMKYNKELMKLAIEYGMIMSVQYRGAEDNFVQGHQRIVYPLVLGTSAKGKPLLRVFHLRGWSVSSNGNMDKDWRMFRTDRILSMSFTGSFYRLPPAGYNMNDKGMRGGIIKAANFDEIRKNQKKLYQQNIIQNKKEIILDDKKGKISVITTMSTNSKLDLKNPWANESLNEKDKKMIRITFLKNAVNNKRIAVLGALGKKGNTVKISTEGKYIGVYKVLKSTMGDALGKPHLRNVGGGSEYDLHVFIKKIN